MFRSESFFFAWEGAQGPSGPWRHLLVLEARGSEAISRDYEYEIELGLADDAPPVALADLLASRATLRIHTESTPAIRLVHGLISEVEELEVEQGHRYRVKLTPPWSLARMMKKSRVFVDKTLGQIIETTLQQRRRGAALAASSDTREEVSEASESYAGFRATYALRIFDWLRLSDAQARPYCVQYAESDVDFVCRLLEEEGIAHHFEHTAEECVLVLSDRDASRRVLADLVLAPKTLHQDVRELRLGGRARPQRVAVDDFDWRKPELDLYAESSFPVDEVVTIEEPGRYGHSPELGQKLAEIRSERHDTERTFASFTSGSRALAAGTLVTVDHPNETLSGVFLVDELNVTMRQRQSFGQADAEPTYSARVVAARSGTKGTPADGLSSHYRPSRRTPRPRIAGTQTAIVTSEPGQEQEINVGGEAELGCVRLAFHWDRDAERLSREPSSCWVRVSQMFAGGRGHGAMFHPRVGDEVVVDFLEGDPDRPLVVGRVYNGKNLAPENATHRPTYSCIKSMSSPYDGNFNMIAFDDLQGEEKFIVHVAKDYIENVRHDASRFVANFDRVEVKGDQETLIHGNQRFTVLAGEDMTLVGHHHLTVRGPQQIFVDGSQSEGVTGGSVRSVTGGQVETIGGSETISVGAIAVHASAAMQVEQAPNLCLFGSVIVTMVGGVVMIKAEGPVNVSGANVDVTASSSANVKAPAVNVNGGAVKVVADKIELNC